MSDWGKALKANQEGHVVRGRVVKRYFDLFSLRSSLKRRSWCGSGARTDRRARKWFARQRSGAFTQSRQSEFERWINKDKKHFEAYQRYEKLWAMLGNFSEKPEIRSARLAIQSNL